MSIEHDPVFKVGYGEHVMQETAVVEVAQLGFARGKVGQKYPLVTDGQKTEFARENAEHTLLLTITDTADCGDERLTIKLEDGTTDPDKLHNRIAPQLFGGITLATTKAAIAADAAFLKGATTMWDAFLIVDQRLKGFGYKGAGHAGCGANAAVESSVANAIALEMLEPSVGLLVPDDGENHDHILQIVANKQRRLEDGFYNAWNPSEFDTFVKKNYPENYSYLEVDEHDPETHGHNGSGLYVVTQQGVGYQKTGHAFSVTLPFMKELADKIGGSDKERRLILLGFADDTLHVGAGIVTEGFPVFAQAA